ncbi:MAG TPA: hypothetical protein VGQ91_14275, partial [Ideonella sp.]|nr:hypothetical protein [Ideonella sp.]
MTSTTPTAAPPQASQPLPERHIPFLEKIGMHRVRVGGGEAVVTIDLQPDLLNNHGGGHGGV